MIGIRNDWFCEDVQFREQQNSGEGQDRASFAKHQHGPWPVRHDQDPVGGRGYQNCRLAWKVRHRFDWLRVCVLELGIFRYFITSGLIQYPNLPQDL